jgi:hypothetical protein
MLKEDALSANGLMYATAISELDRKLLPEICGLLILHVI